MHSDLTVSTLRARESARTWATKRELVNILSSTSPQLRASESLCSWRRRYAPTHAPRRANFEDQAKGYKSFALRGSRRPNSGVRPGTWVTKQTGNIGYTR